MDAASVAAWKDLCQQLAPAFTARTYVTFLHVLTAWALSRSRPAVTGLVLTVGQRLLGHAAKHWTTYERFFHRARGGRSPPPAWSLEEVSRLLLARVVMPLVDEFGQGGGACDGACDGPPPVSLTIDDTTAARHGKHVAFAGYFKDASASNVLKTVCHWSHNWVVGCVHFRCRFWPGRVIPLPALFALYRKPADRGRRACPFRTRHELAAEMLGRARAALPGRRIEVGVDGQYATRTLCGALRRDAGESLVKHAADHFGPNWKTAKAVEKAYLNRTLGPVDLDGVTRLAMDEFAIRKGHRYATVVIDPTTGRRVPWVGRGAAAGKRSGRSSSCWAPSGASGCRRWRWT